MESQDTPNAPQLCGAGCGFFANAGTNGMCSKCYRETQAAEQKAQAALAASAEVPVVSQPPSSPLAQPTPTPAAPSTSLQVPQPATESHMQAAASSSTSDLPAEAPSPSTTAAAAQPESTSKPITRCQQCRKKVGLTGFKCKCGMLFCGQHRYAEAHNCTFDYKSVERERLAANNPLVQASKVQRI